MKKERTTLFTTMHRGDIEYDVQFVTYECNMFID